MRVSRQLRTVRIVSGSDSTRSHEAERPTPDEVALYRVFVASSPDGIVAIDASSRILTVNPALERMFGYSAQELIGSRLMRLMPDRLRAQHLAGIERYLATGVRRLDWRGSRAVGQRSDGSEFPIVISFGDAEMNGQRTFLGFLRDVSCEVAASAALLQAKQLHETILASVGEGIIGQNAAGNIVFVNATAARILGTTVEDLVGRNLHDALCPAHTGNDSLPADGCALARAVESTHSMHLDDGALLRPDGSVVSVDAVATPMGDGDIAQGTVIAFRDITARRALEEQLRQTQKMEAVGQLAGGIAHDFNNLLTVILSHAQFLLEHDAPPDAKEDARAIHEAGSRAAALTHQLLAYSRRQVLRPAAIHVRDVVAGLEPMLLRLIGEHIAFVTYARTTRDLVFVDRGQLEQVITNLVLNARDAMPRGGGLTVEVCEGASSDEVVLRVIDSGVGMLDNVRANAFEPFYTTKLAGEGTGLGLSTAFGIVSQSGGRIEIDSSVNVGTTVTVTLPIAENAARDIDAAIEPSPLGTGDVARAPRSGEVILLAEDEEPVRRVVARILRGAGYVVLEARHGADAILVAARHQGQIALLLTDVVMPQVSGVELAAWYRTAYPDGAVIFLSGYPNDDLFRRGLSTEDIQFVQKPFTAAKILEAVDEALRARR